MTNDKRYTICPHCGTLNRIPTQVETGKQAKCGKCTKEFSPDATVHETSGLNLKRTIINSPVPIIIDCWASWCGPCKSFGPTFEQLSKKYPHDIICVKLNTEIEQQMASELEIRSIPTIIIINQGQEISRQSGALPLPALETWIRTNGIKLG